MMNNKNLLLVLCLCFSLMGCGQENKSVGYFKDTDAYKLAQAVGKNDTVEIRKIVERFPKFLEITNPITGSNVLGLAVILENYEAFKTLIDLGANPNFVNPLTKRSVLIDATKFYWKPEPYSIDLRFMDLLLQKGANPNYVLEKDFTNEKGICQRATSAIHQASGLDLDMVKLLIRYGADPYHKLEQYKHPPFYNSLLGSEFDISNYFIDSLKVNIKEPIFIVLQEPENKVVEYYLQDEIVTKYTKAKLKGDTPTIERLEKENPEIGEASQERWKFIKKLESMGVDFKNYEYKK